MSRPARTVALATVASAAALSALTLTAGTADAATAPVAHCTAWKAVGKTTVSTRLCGKLVTTKAGRSISVSLGLKNSGTKAQQVTGTFMAGWGQAGSGDDFQPTTVAAKKTTTLVTRFTDVGKGTYTVSAIVQVGKATAKPSVSFTK